MKAGIFRLNRFKPTDGVGDVECSLSRECDSDLTKTFVDLETTLVSRSSTPSRRFSTFRPVGLTLQSALRADARQLRLLIEKVKKRQKNRLIYNTDYAILTNAAPFTKIGMRHGPPTPHDISLSHRETRAPS